MRIALALLFSACAPSTVYVEAEGGAYFTPPTLAPYAAVRAGVTFDVVEKSTRPKRKHKSDAGAAPWVPYEPKMPAVVVTDAGYARLDYDREDE